MNASLLSAVLMSGSAAGGALPAGNVGGLPSFDTQRAAAAVGTVPLLAEVQSCGWFESSWELQHGLAVSDLPDTDALLAALWFPARRAGVPVAAGRLLQ